MLTGGVVADELALGKAVASARRDAGLTQQELCVKAGLSYSTLAKIERGAIKSPSVFTLVAIARATNITVEQLVGVSPNSGSNQPQRQYKTSKNGIKFVYFDINDVMVRSFQKAFMKLSDEAGHSPELVESTFWHYNDSVCRGEMSLDEFNKILSDRLGLDSVDWKSYYMDAVEPIPEAQDLIKWAADHYRVGLLSNIMPSFIDEMVKRGLLPAIDYAAIIDSSRVGMVKPEVGIFELAQKEAKVAPEEILYTDDSRSNLMSAERCGWRVLWFDNYRPQDSSERIKTLLEF